MLEAVAPVPANRLYLPSDVRANLHESRLSKAPDMTDRPIIFSAPMVRALIDGRKTQTRRLAWSGFKREYGIQTDIPKPTIWQKARPGDQLWVREAFAQTNTGDLDYRASAPFAVPPIDCVSAKFGTATRAVWRPSIHMPRWVSRLTLVVTGVKAERVRNISEGDAEAEGMPEPYLGDGDQPFEEVAMMVSRRTQFRNLWNQLHSDDAWDANPEVIALAFTVEPRNIDSAGTGRSS